MLFTGICFITAGIGRSQDALLGRILDPYLTPIPGINICNRDTVVLAETDWEGYFELNHPPKELLVMGLGYQWTKININQNCEALELILPEEGNYDYRSHRKVDRIRLKAFNGINQTHLQAYQQGFFKTPLPCYTRKFESWKPELDEIRKWMKGLRENLRATYKTLVIGDTIRIPCESWSAYTDATLESECSYMCIIQSKNRKKGWNLTCETLPDPISKLAPTLNGMVLKPGTVIEHKMKYFAILKN
ncbi:MAG: hypothetical protein RLZZ241_858 [Bacteroidota bacterium]|jgi:hypothetical protein